MACRYHDFETALGTILVAWTELGISRVLLPGHTPEALGALARWESAPPDWLVRVGEQLSGLLGGEEQDFSDLPLDLSQATPFQRFVYEGARAVGFGEVTTYGALADRIGRHGSARAVGGAMGKNPLPLIVPCHRVLAAGGLGGFTAPGGIGTKERLLEIEGRVQLGGNRRLMALTQRGRVPPSRD
jgi:methylated-DNA-[protein]-cysteine S-methyltransferase